MANKKKSKIDKFRLIALIVIIILFIHSVFHSRNYQQTYNVSGIEVTESYNKKTKYYTLTFNYNEQNYITKIKHKYISNHKLVKDIAVNQDDNTTCLIPISNKLDTYPICKQNEEYISYYLVNNKDLVSNYLQENTESNPTTFSKLTLYNLNNHKYLIWNYKGFYLVTPNKTEEITLFNEDIYAIPLASQVKNYFVIPNYAEKYNFSKFYVVDINKFKVKELNLKNSISYEAYILGSFNNKVYLVDKKNQKEYEIYPKRLVIDNIISKNQGKIVENDEWTKITLNKLVTQENSFTTYQEIKYLIENDNLYEILDSQKILITKDKVKTIVATLDNTVYYLKEDKLYCFNENDGEVLIMQNFEWNFNYENMIFIY